MDTKELKQLINECHEDYILKFRVDVFSGELISIELPEELINRESGLFVADVLQDLEGALGIERQKYFNKYHHLTTNECEKNI